MIGTAKVVESVLDRGIGSDNEQWAESWSERDGGVGRSRLPLGFRDSGWLAEEFSDDY
jgi:hypothetical protein